MQRMKADAIIVIGGLVALMSACTPPPVRVQVETPGVSDSKVEMISGETCTAPCAITLPPKESESELRVSAPGYYPARLRIDKGQAAFTAGAQGRKDALLSIPLEHVRADPPPSP